MAGAEKPLLTLAETFYHAINEHPVWEKLAQVPTAQYRVIDSTAKPDSGRPVNVVWDPRAQRLEIRPEPLAAGDLQQMLAQIRTANNPFLDPLRSIVAEQSYIFERKPEGVDITWNSRLSNGQEATHQSIDGQLVGDSERVEERMYKLALYYLDLISNNSLQMSMRHTVQGNLRRLLGLR